MSNNSKDNKNSATLRAVAAMAQSPMFIYERGAQSLLLRYQSFLENATISEELAKSALKQSKENCAVKFYNSNNEVYTGSFQENFTGKIKEDSIAVVPVMGAMMRDDYCDMALNFVAGTRSLERTISDLDKNQNINAVVLHVVTPGGQAMGNESLANVIKKSKTPIVVYFEMMASAGVFAFQGANEIYGAESDSLWGSIGTYITIVDNSKMLEAMGYDIKEIYATDSTEKNKEFREAFNGNDDPMIEWLDRTNKAFVSHVKKVRPSLKDDGQVFKGKIYAAKDAQKIGAIDGVGSLDFVMKRARILGKKQKSGKGDKHNSLKNEQDMPDENKGSLWNKLFGSKNETEVVQDLEGLKNELDGSKNTIKDLNAAMVVETEKVQQLELQQNTLIEEKAALSTELEALKNEVAPLNPTHDSLVAHNKELGGNLEDAATPVDGVQENGKNLQESNEAPLTAKEKHAQVLKKMDEQKEV